jgi:hypothetical protein
MSATPDGKAPGENAAADATADVQTRNSQSGSTSIDSKAAQPAEIPPQDQIEPTGGLEHVPRSERRGLLAWFLLVPEAKNAYLYSNGTKWLMTGIVALAATTSSVGSSIFYRT